MNIDVNEAIEYMKKWDKKVMSLNNGWNIKQIANHSEYEVFNDDENQIYACPNKQKLKDIIEMIN